MHLSELQHRSVCLLDVSSAYRPVSIATLLHSVSYSRRIQQLDFRKPTTCC